MGLSLSAYMEMREDLSECTLKAIDGNVGVSKCILYMQMRADLNGHGFKTIDGNMGMSLHAYIE